MACTEPAKLWAVKLPADWESPRLNEPATPRTPQFGSGRHS